MSKVIDALRRSENALLESPTGTGKTLCLLCAALAWQREVARSSSSAVSGGGGGSVEPPLKGSSSASVAGARRPTKLPTIVYASRTHSQLSQVVRELRNTRYRPKHAVLGSRELMCVNPKVKTSGSTSSDVDRGCAKLGKDRKCRFRNNLEGFVAPSDESRGNVGGGGGGCGGGGGGEAQQPVLDVEDLVTLGKKRSICPFYYTRSHVKDAELVLVPYNYLFDKDARTSALSDIDFTGSVLIFDEAHNLEGFASESASFDLTGCDVGGCVSEVSRAVGYLRATPERAECVKMDNLVRLKSIFLQFEEYLENGVPTGSGGGGSNGGGSYGGEYMFEIFRRGANLTYDNHTVFLKFVRQVADMITECRGTSAAGSSGTPKLDHFVSCVKRVFGGTSEMQSLAKARAYRVHVAPKPSSPPGSSNSGRTLSYWCFAPSLSMRELSSLNVRSIVVTSGTLSPLPSYSLELGLKFPHCLENPHIVSSNQIHVRVVGKGVSGKVLNSSYGNRDDPKYVEELGNTLVSLSRVVPGGMLVFFPSYGVMENCVERWGGPLSSRSRYGGGNNHGGKSDFFAARRRRRRLDDDDDSGNQYAFPRRPVFAGNGGTAVTPWKRLLSQKAVVLEPKMSSKLRDAIAEFESFLDPHSSDSSNNSSSPGCVLMGVCRGKISEGIDFANDKCRAVVITGLPFPPYLDPKVKLKREFLDNAKMNRIGDAKMSVKGEGGFSPEGKEVVKAGKRKEDEDEEKTKAGPSRSGDVDDPEAALGGAEWYTQQAHRAVNQAIGRVVRHRDDYGAILLLDARFGEARNKCGLSKWVRPHVRDDEGMGRAISGLVKFYRDAKREASEREKRGEGGGNLRLGYEEDGRDGRGATTARSAAAAAKKEEEEEGEEDPSRRIEREDELMKKIAVIRTEDAVSSSAVVLGGDGGGGGTSTAGNDTVAGGGGYVRPGRIIKRITLSDTPKKQPETEEGRPDGDDDDEDGRRLSSAGPSDVANEETRGGRPSGGGSSHGDGGKERTDGGLAALYGSATTGSSSSLHRRRKHRLLASTEGPTSTSSGGGAWANLGEGRTKKEPLAHRNGVTHKDGRSSEPPRDGDRRSAAATASTSRSSPALRFFESATSRLTSRDLSTAKKLLVAMKRSGDDRDVEGYMESAKALVELLLRYDSAYDDERGGDEGDDGAKAESSSLSLLELLLPLLPAERRHRIERAAHRMRFDESELRRECEARALPDEERRSIRSAALKLMKSRDDDDDIASSTTATTTSRAYLREVQQILKKLMKCDEDAGCRTGRRRPFAESLLPLLPPRHRPAATALARQLRTDREVERTRRAERNRTVERRTANNDDGGAAPAAPPSSSSFRGSSSSASRPTTATSNDADHGPADPEELDAVRNMEEALMRAEAYRRAARERLREATTSSTTTAKKEPSSRVGTAAGGVGAGRRRSNPYAASSAAPRRGGASTGPNRPIGTASTGEDVGSGRRGVDASATTAGRPSDPSGRSSPPPRSTKRPRGDSTATAIAAAPSSEEKGRRPSAVAAVSPIVSSSPSSERKTAPPSSSSSAPPPPSTQEELLDPLDRCLRRARNEPYRKPTPRVVRMNRRIRTNVPEGFSCSVCDCPSEKPFVADCGHSACLGCWIRWLDKAGTCPICRAPTTKENLARMVFEREAGAGAPTLSQMCPSDGDGDDDDEPRRGKGGNEGDDEEEEELEFVT